jgi:tetratricopeptide (TPR) repeat protein
MNAQAGARQCPQCNAPSGPQARFCTSCGGSLEHPACVRCGQFLAVGARFCTACGAPAAPADSTAKETALVSVIAALELALYRADPRRVLQMSLDALAKAPSTEQGVVGSVTAMCAYAQLGDFEQAQSCLLKARSLFATHLGLTEQQQSRFIRDGHLIDDLMEAGDRGLRESPWLYFIMGHTYGPSLPAAYIGETEAEKRKTAMDTWAGYYGNDQQRFWGALGFLYFSNGQYREATKHFETVMLMTRRYESISPVRIELVWPLVTVGNCYWEDQEHAKAAACWQRARSVEMCIEPGINTDDWNLLALPWIEQAKSRLVENDQPVPAPVVSGEASKHLASAIKYLLEAEQYEAGGVLLDELLDMIRRAGRRYTGALERATSELEYVERLDHYAWGQSPASNWWRHESAKAMLLEKTALVHLTNEKLALAIAAYKQANEIWPMVRSYGVMGGLQAACGLKADAAATYRTCIDRAEAFGAVESSNDSEEILAEIRQALNGLA